MNKKTTDLEDRHQYGLNEEPFYERLRREDKARHEKEKREAIQRRARQTHASSHNPDGQCLLNLLTFEDYA